MRNGKLYACALFILLLMALRLCFPVQAGQAQAWVEMTLDPCGGCRSAALALGRDLDSVGLRGGMVAVFRLGEEALG